MPTAPEPNGFEFRPHTSEEASDGAALMKYVFAGENEPGDNEPDSPVIPEWTQCAFDGSSLVAMSAAFPFVVRVNGKTVAMHGVTSVGTDPAYRRRGLVRRLITDLLHRGRDEGFAGSILLASMGAIYQRFGYGLASNITDYRFDPRMAALQFPMAIDGQTRRVAIDDALPIVKHVFREYVKDKNMMALRADVTWNLLLGLAGKNKPEFVVHYDGEDQPDAYCVYSMTSFDRDDAGPNQELTITDFYYTSMSGYRALWEYICAHDLVGRVVWGSVPEDDPAPGILLEPRCLNQRLGDGLWFRVIDIEQMLKGRGYDCEGDLTIGIEGDDICPWNNGSYRLSVAAGEASVEATTSKPDLVCSVQGVASLLAGYGSATWLHRNGRLTARDELTLSQGDRLFATRYRPHLSFGF